MRFGQLRQSMLLYLIAFSGFVSPLCAAPAELIALDNGMQVYLKPVAADSARIDLRLIIEFGADDEKDGEHGWAHLVEHMAFNGTERFPTERMRALFQQADSRPGGDVNASTSDKHTIYKLAVPDGNLGQLQENLELTVDWLSAMHFSTAELAREKRVIAAEALASQQRLAQQRRWQKALFNGEANRYSAIGVMAEVQAASAQNLTEFWRRSYRTDRAILLVTGDFVAADVAELIVSDVTSPSCAALTNS